MKSEGVHKCIFSVSCRLGDQESAALSISSLPVPYGAPQCLLYSQHMVGCITFCGYVHGKVRLIRLMWNSIFEFGLAFAGLVAASTGGHKLRGGGNQRQRKIHDSAPAVPIL